MSHSLSSLAGPWIQCMCQRQTEGRRRGRSYARPLWAAPVLPHGNIGEIARYQIENTRTPKWAMVGLSGGAAPGLAFEPWSHRNSRLRGLERVCRVSRVRCSRHAIAHPRSEPSSAGLERRKSCRAKDLKAQRLPQLPDRTGSDAIVNGRLCGPLIAREAVDDRAIATPSCRVQGHTSVDRC